jgi:hypothetical protein
MATQAREDYNSYQLSVSTSARPMKPCGVTTARAVWCAEEATDRWHIALGKAVPRHVVDAVGPKVMGGCRVRRSPPGGEQPTEALPARNQTTVELSLSQRNDDEE